MRTTIAFAVLFACAATVGGCVTINPWERGRLANHARTDGQSGRRREGHGRVSRPRAPKGRA